MGPIGFPETSVKNYHYLLRDNTEEHTPEDGTERWSHNVGKELPLLAA